MRKAPRYFPRPWNDGDTLGQAFAELTLQDIYRAMRVCRAWHWIIHNTNLRCLTFIDPLPKDAWPAVQWNQIFIDFPEQRPYFVELRRRPFTVNPILDRTWIFRDPAMTTAPGPADITLSESPGRTKGAVTVPELPLENLLEAMPLSIDFRALLMKGHDRLTPQDLERLSRSGWHTHSGMGRGPMYGQLVDIRERYFARIEQMYTLPAAMLCEQDEHGVDVLPQESWKRMFLTQPPVNAVAIKHPTMPVAWKMEVGAGVRIYHVLQTVRKMLGPMPRALCKSYLHEAGNELQILVALKDADKKVARSLVGALYRPLSVKLKVELGHVASKEDPP